MRAPDSTEEAVADHRRLIVEALIGVASSQPMLPPSIV